MAIEPGHFGDHLRRAREEAGLSREQLAQRAELDVSYIYRIEIGERRPSRGATLALAEALKTTGEEINQWLLTAGHAPQPLLTMVRGRIRTRGGNRRPGGETDSTSSWDAARWVEWMEAMGLREGMIGRMLKAMETAKLPKRQAAADAVRAAFSAATRMLEAPVQTAVIPAAGGQHNVITAHVMQRLLLYAINEAAECGISNIILILAPETIESLYVPLKEALQLSGALAVQLSCCEQSRPEGLGDAILRAEESVGMEPFAVLLVDDFVRERASRSTSPNELGRMMEAYRDLGDACLIAATTITRHKMVQKGVARLENKAIRPDVFPVRQLVEKPDPDHPICRDRQAYGIVGRYILSSRIFKSLRVLSEKGSRPVELTDALERLRRDGEPVHAFQLAAARLDAGEALGHASELFGKVLNERSHRKRR